MDNPEVFREAASALEAQGHLALVTVIGTSGSTPGKPGYKMLVFADRRETLGTVGGGWVEARMVEQAGETIRRPRSRTVRFELGETPDDEKGICGGSVELLVETFDRTALPLFRDLAAAADDDESGVLVSIIAPDELPRKFLLKNARQIDAATEGRFAPEVIAAIQEAATLGQGGTRVSTADMDVFVEGVARSPELIIFGAGHLSYYIAKYAKSIHFKVGVYDDRAEYANRERFRDADAVVVEDFGRVLGKVRIDQRSYVVIVTRGHKCDEIVLEQVLKTDAKYIGMIGSKRKTLMILEHLRNKGHSEEALRRVYSPIGVAIGAVTPEEIALSIVCELVKIRRLGHEPGIGHMTLSPSGARR